MKRRIKQNIWGNWNGYEGARKVVEFGTNEQGAQEWFAGLEEKEKALRAHIIKILPKTETSGVSGKVANVLAKNKTVATVEDWDALWKFVIKNKATDLLQRRVNQAAVDARWEEKKKIPGVAEFNVVTLSLTKIK